jgi:hypothetical protein
MREKSMRISSPDRVAGQPVLQIRKLLRLGEDYVWGQKHVEIFLGVDATTAEQVLKMLDAEGYIERDQSRPKDVAWINTIKGNALAHASAARPVKRATAERDLNAFLSRVQQVNVSSQYACVVKTVVLFGSYVSSAPSVSGVDLALELVARREDREGTNIARQQRGASAKEEGRAYKSSIDTLLWPWQGVWRFLQAHSRIISLYNLPDEEGLLRKTPHQTLVGVWLPSDDDSPSKG